MFDWDADRRRMIAETSAFIEWGLANPDKVRWIPRRRVGSGGWSRSMQVAFWGGVLATAGGASRALLARFLRWAKVRR